MAKTAKIKTLINPHDPDERWFPRTTKEAVGLENVDNTSDMEKPVSTAVKNYIDGLQDRFLSHAKQHATGGSDPITPASIGAAPAGYGLGVNTGKLITDGNDALVGGWFYWGKIDTNLPFTYGHLRVDPRLMGETSGRQILMQTAYSDSYPGCVAQRKLADGVWKPWEWVNPPMVSGTEYRTTERCQNKAVYKKLDTDGVIKWRLDGETTWHTDKPISKSVTLSASGWDSSAKTQTVTASGVLADETKQLITPTPALASQTAYYEAVVLCTGQSADQLTFTAKKIPTDDLTVYITIQEVGA